MKVLLNRDRTPDDDAGKAALLSAIGALLATTTGPDRDHLGRAFDLALLDVVGIDAETVAR